MGRSIHITRGGQKFGPYQEDTARQHLGSGSLKADDLAWHSGADGWKPLSDVLNGAAAVAPPSPPPPLVEEEPKIRVNRGGQEIGPYTRSKAVEYFAAGQLLPTDFAWNDASQSWAPLNQVLGVAAPTGMAPVTGYRPKPMNKDVKEGLIWGGGSLLLISIFAAAAPTAFGLLLIPLVIVLYIATFFAWIQLSWTVFKQDPIKGLICFFLPVIGSIIVPFDRERWDENKNLCYIFWALVLVRVFLLLVTAMFLSLDE